MGGTKGGIDQINTITPEQQEVFSKLLGDFDPTSLQKMFQTSVADPARQQFQQQTLPGIQEKFIAGGGSRSGAFNRAATGAGANLETGLAAQLAQLLGGAEQNQLGRQAQLSTTPTFENFQRPSENPLMDLLAPVAGGLAIGAGSAGAGAATGGLTSFLSGKNKNTTTPTA